jgi:hypothetical protein
MCGAYPHDPEPGDGSWLLSALAIDLPLGSVVSMGSLDPLNGSGNAGRT